MRNSRVEICGELLEFYGFIANVSLRNLGRDEKAGGSFSRCQFGIGGEVARVVEFYDSWNRQFSGESVEQCGLEQGHLCVLVRGRGDWATGQ